MYWKVTVLYYGHITSPKSSATAGLDEDLVLNNPYLGFLLQKDGENVLVDCGINERSIVDGKAWAGKPAAGGSQFVLDALDREGLKPSDIDTVIYTHLHNDHAGACHLFPDALTVYQKDEWRNLLDPLPSQRIRGDYDMAVIDCIRNLKNKCIVNGDGELANGLKYYKTPGHSLGSMSIYVPTEHGPRVIIGDFCHYTYMLFPQTDRMMLADGTIRKITPLPENIGPVFVNNVVYDHYAFYDSYYKLKSIVPKFEPQYFLCGHDAKLLFTGAKNDFK